MRMKMKNVDMVNGPLFVSIWRFTVPFMLTGLLQIFYNAADVMVVGRYAGQEALAGVGTTGSLSTLILNFIIGLSVGVSVTLGQALGAKDYDGAEKIVHTAMVLCFLGGAVVSAVGIIFARPLLSLIDVPEDVMPQAKIYMQIIFAGKIPALVYNFGSAVLRAKGDTKRPLYIVTVSGIINVVLNMFFVIKLGMKADGVGLATVISQVFTAVAILYCLRTEEGHTRLYFKKIRLYKKEALRIVKIGLPSGVQSMVFSLANVIIQSGVNSFGSSATIAGNSAATRGGGFYSVALNSLSQTTVAFVSSNTGAKRFDRVRKIVRYSMIDVAIVWAAEVLVTLLFAKHLVGLYVPGNEAALQIGVSRHMIIGCSYGLCGIMEVASGAIRGMGKSFLTMMVAIAGVCGIRIVWVLFIFPLIGTYPSLVISMPLSWIVTSLLQYAMYLYVFQKEKKAEMVSV